MFALSCFSFLWKVCKIDVVNSYAVFFSFLLRNFVAVEFFRGAVVACVFSVFACW